MVWEQQNRNCSQRFPLGDQKHECFCKPRVKAKRGEIQGTESSHRSELESYFMTEWVTKSKGNVCCFQEQLFDAPRIHIGTNNKFKWIYGY